MSPVQYPDNIAFFQFTGQLELRRVQQLGEIARGTDPNSGMYNAIANAIIAMGTFLYESLF